MKKTSVLTKSLYFAFGIFAFTFLISLNFRPYPFSFLIKSIPVFCLALASFSALPSTKGKLLTLGFLFSAFGDIFLEIDPETLFVYGLGSFLIAHIFFIFVFLNQSELKGFKKYFAVLLIIYGIIIGTVLFPHLADLKIPVIVYLCIVMGMGIAASTGKINHQYVIIGALLFIFSDSLIAINKFLFELPAKNFLIMTTYYLGQFFICFGSVKQSFKNNSL